MSEIAGRLDKVASSLEATGLVRLAALLDMVSNTLDRTAGKYDHIDFRPPKGVAEAAARGLELRRRARPSDRGGLTTQQAAGIGSGVQRAVNLRDRDTLSPETVRKMHRFFSRHEKNKSIDPGKTPETDKGYQAWLLWGGDPGAAWARKVVRKMDAVDG